MTIRTDFTLEVNPVAFLPHLSLQRLTRHHRLYKANLRKNAAAGVKRPSMCNSILERIRMNVIESLKCSGEEWISHEAHWLPTCTSGSQSKGLLTLMALNLEGSLAAKCLRTCLAAKPNEHKPCRMGALKPGCGYMTSKYRTRKGTFCVSTNRNSD